MGRALNPADIVPMGAYSQGMAVPLGDATLIATAGQIAADAAGNPLAPGDLGEQTRVVFENLKLVLAEAGARLEHVFKVQIFLTDMSQFAAVSAVRNEYLDGIDPVSTLVEITRTVIDGCDIEIEAMAIIPNESEV